MCSKSNQKSGHVHLRNIVRRSGSSRNISAVGEFLVVWPTTAAAANAAQLDVPHLHSTHCSDACALSRPRPRVLHGNQRSWPTLGSSSPQGRALSARVIVILALGATFGRLIAGALARSGAWGQRGGTGWSGVTSKCARQKWLYAQPRSLRLRIRYATPRARWRRSRLHI